MISRGSGTASSLAHTSGSFSSQGELHLLGVFPDLLEQAIWLHCDEQDAGGWAQVPLCHSVCGKPGASHVTSLSLFPYLISVPSYGAVGRITGLQTCHPNILGSILNTDPESRPVSPSPPCYKPPPSLPGPSLLSLLPPLPPQATLNLAPRGIRWCPSSAQSADIQGPLEQSQSPCSLQKTLPG